MRLIKSHSNDIYFNLTSEKYFLDNYKEPVFMLWVSSPSIVIGKNQNTLEEINYQFVKDNKIKVARRLSGGGAVFHDYGNLNFTFISKKESGTLEEQFKKFTDPIINFLRSIGANAEFAGRNDILIDGKKCSGNAQFYQKDLILHHGTLLYNSNMSSLVDSLKPDKKKYESKGVSSVKSRVTNIKNHIKHDWNLEEFRNNLLNYIKENYDDSYILDYRQKEIDKINMISNDIYSTWDYIYGNSPKYNLKNKKKFKGGFVECLLNVNKGYIEEIEIYGDFFGMKDIKELKHTLKGLKHEENILKEHLSNLNDYINNVTIDEFISLLF